MGERFLCSLHFISPLPASDSNGVGPGVEGKGNRKGKEFSDQERTGWTGSDLNVCFGW